MAIRGWTHLSSILCPRLRREISRASFSVVAEAGNRIETLEKDSAIEPDLPVIEAEPRDPKFSGRRRKNDKLREFGKIPALLNKVPTEDGGIQQQMLSIPTTHFLRIIKTVGGTDAFLSHVLRMKVSDDAGSTEYRVLPRQLRFSNVNYRPNNATFRVLRPDDDIRVSVPILVIGEDSCPGVKQNGFPLILKRSLVVKCRGDNVPKHISADISQLEFNEKIFVRDLSLPEGCSFVNMDPRICVCKVSPFK